MAKKSVVLTITIWDDQVRLSFVSKTMASLVSKSFYLNVEVDEDGIRSVDPFEIVYFIRTGIQQLMSLKNVAISAIGIAAMPGYFMVWDRIKCTPISPMYLPNNGLKKLKFQEFKFSEFNSLLVSNHGQDSLETPNVAINLWTISKKYPGVTNDGVIYSGVDTWLGYLLSGYDDQSLVTTQDMVRELLFNHEWDSSILSSLGLTESFFPRLVNTHSIVTKNFYPLDDGVAVMYNDSATTLLSSMLNGYSNEPVACVHLSTINHIYFNHLNTKKFTEKWVRFSAESAIQKAFGFSDLKEQPSLSLSDINDDILISTNPFQSFFSQTYHLLNVSECNSDVLARLGTLNTLFLIKFLISHFEKITTRGHIKTLLVSSSEWDLSTLQLCIDLCQLDGIEFKVSNWMDMIHIHQFTMMDTFFSLTEQQRLFKVKTRLIPSLDPLSCYSLYQPWEDWFNKLYDFRY